VILTEKKLADLHGIGRSPWDWLIGEGLRFELNFGDVLTSTWIGIGSAKD
jgi:hypothetical protein